MNARTARIAWVLGTGALLVAGIGLGYWWGHARQPSEDAATATSKPKALYWYDPMVPDQHFDKPGKSPFMDMELLPKYPDQANEGGTAIDSSVRQNLGIRTVEAKLGHLAGGIRVPGTITWDLRQERVVSARVDAVVERLFVKAPYEPVRAGQPLASVLAPVWSTAMAEARALGQAQSSTARNLQSAAHERLRALGLPAGASGRNGAIVLSAPISGVVSEIGVREGQSAPAGTLLFRVNGTQTVWLEAALPQAAATDITAGTQVEASVSALPGRRFTGRVETLLPQLDPSSRTQRARIVLDNRDGLLAPGMFAEIDLTPSKTSEVPLVPADALIGSGREARVIVQDLDGRFRPISVQAGRSGGGFVEILAGLKGGERVVASGQFLIDSEANLSGALDRLRAVPSVPVTHAPPVEKARKVLYWYDPMKPDRHFDKPGKSPYMDMPLVPKYEDEQGPGAKP